MNRKRGISKVQSSFQKAFLSFETIADGVVEYPTCKRLYLMIQPINVSLMNDEEKGDMIKELSTLFAMLENTTEISMHTIDKQADVLSNIELLQTLSELNDNRYVQDYLTEKTEELFQASESGTERSFFLCLTYPKTYDTVSILADARQLIAQDTCFSIRLMREVEIKKAFMVYCVRDFSDIDEIYSHEQPLAQFKNEMTPLKSRFLPTYAQIGDLFIQTFVIRKYPQKANRMILFERLSKLHGVDISIRLNKIDDFKVNKGIDKTIHASKQLFETANKETEKMESRKKQEELVKMYERMLSENENMYTMSIFIQIKSFKQEDLMILEQRVLRELKIISFVKETPQLLQKQAWISCAPFGDNHLVHLIGRNVPLSTATCVMPFVYSGRKDEKGQLIGEDSAGGKMLVDFEKKDFEVTNTNISIIGESGQGKTRLEHMIMLQKFIRGNKLYIEDPEREHSVFVNKLGGTYIQPGGMYRINPLEVFDYGGVDDENLYTSQTSNLRQHIGWLIDFFKTYNNEVNGDLIAILLEDFYILQGYSFSTSKVVESSPILADFYDYIEGELKDFDKKVEAPIYQKEQLEYLLQQIHGVCIGSDADLCNGRTNMANSDIVAWDLNDLLSGSKQRLRIMQYVISGYVWNQVVKHRYTNKVTYVISELSLRLHKEYLESIITLVGMLKRFRKYEADMMLSTQNPYDMLRSGIREYTASLFTSPSFRFLFYPGDGDQETFIKTVNITPTEYTKIAKSKKGNVLFTAGATKYNVQISKLSQTELSLYGKGVGL